MVREPTVILHVAAEQCIKNIFAGINSLNGMKTPFQITFRHIYIYIHIYTHIWHEFCDYVGARFSICGKDCLLHFVDLSGKARGCLEVHEASNKAFTRFAVRDDKKEPDRQTQQPSVPI